MPGFHYKLPCSRKNIHLTCSSLRQNVITIRTGQKRTNQGVSVSPRRHSQNVWRLTSCNRELYRQSTCRDYHLSAFYLRSYRENRFEILILPRIDRLQPSSPLLPGQTLSEDRKTKSQKACHSCLLYNLKNMCIVD